MWWRYLKILGCCVVTALAGLYAFILLVDPFGVSPLSLIRDDILPNANRRFVVPQIVRSGRFDSFQVGTSTMDRITPGTPERVFGGRFANVSLQAATPFETELVLASIGGNVPKLRHVLIGIDYTWCSRRPPPQYHQVIRIPEHLYRGNKLSIYANLLSLATLRLARQKLAVKLGWDKQRFTLDGNRPNLEPDRPFGPEVLGRIYRGQTRPAWLAQPELGPPDVKLTDKDLPAAAFPALVHLAAGLDAVPPAASVIVILMAPHAVSLPEPRSVAAHDLEVCKLRIAEIAAARKAQTVDMMYVSRWTADDKAFQDYIHYNYAIGDLVLDRVREAIDTKGVTADGVARYLAGAAGPRATK